MQTVHVPFLYFTQANASGYNDIISIIVDDSLYSGSVKSGILQYANDIQGYLPNTRVAIFPVSSQIRPNLIAALNEKLFYEGDGNGLSRLVGTVLVGNVPLPIVHRNNKAFPSVYPYIDFDQKNFVYDETQGAYNYTSKSLTNDKPEIWHSVIAPNTGSASKDATKLTDFFTKTHAYYTKSGMYSAANTAVPYVFYFDGLHDQLSTRLVDWKAYNLGLAHTEDVTYHRYSKYLGRAINDAYNAITQADEGDLSGAINAIVGSYTGSSVDFSTVPDISVKNVMDNVVQPFYGIFNSTYIGDILKYVHNAGRYNTGSGNDVSVDMVPTIIAKQDSLSTQIIKDSNTAMEQAIRQQIQNGIARNIPVFTNLTTVITDSTTVTKNRFF